VINPNTQKSKSAKLNILKKDKMYGGGGKKGGSGSKEIQNKEPARKGGKIRGRQQKKK
jgi:hypothetical protein